MNPVGIELTLKSLYLRKWFSALCPGSWFLRPVSVSSGHILLNHRALKIFQQHNTTKPNTDADGMTNENMSVIFGDLLQHIFNRNSKSVKCLLFSIVDLLFPYHYRETNTTRCFDRIFELSKIWLLQFAFWLYIWAG